jgi:hypothetical protein
MKTVKVKKRYLKDLSFMYRDLGLIYKDEDGRDTVDPDKVLMSKEDLKELEKNIKSQLKKENPLCRDVKLESSVNMHLLNIGPNSLAEDAIKKGYMIIL